MKNFETIFSRILTARTSCFSKKQSNKEEYTSFSMKISLINKRKKKTERKEPCIFIGMKIGVANIRRGENE